VNGSPSPVGDYDGSQSVGAGDLNLVLNNWNATVPPVPAGWTGDQPEPGVIGAVALNKVLNNWGNVGGGFTGPGTLAQGFVRYVTSGAGAGAAVPEPSSVVLVGIGLGSIAVAGRRKTKRDESA
jgi:PEP-CTERM motif